MARFDKILYPSTMEIIKFCINLVVRAAVLALTWVFILGIGVGLNWLINWILQELMAPKSVAQYSGQIVFAYILILGLAATLTSFKDVLALTIAGLRNSAAHSATDTVGDAKDDEQENPPR